MVFLLREVHSALKCFPLLHRKARDREIMVNHLKREVCTSLPQWSCFKVSEHIRLSVARSPSTCKSD